MHQMKMLQKAIEFTLKPLCSLGFHGFHCVDKDGFFRHIHPVLALYTAEISEWKEIVGNIQGIKTFHPFFRSSSV